MNLSLLRYSLLLFLNVAIVKIMLPQVPVLPLILAVPLILNGIDWAVATEVALALRVVSLTAFLVVYPFLASNEKLAALITRHK